jgi:hypothetical protein
MLASGVINVRLIVEKEKLRQLVPDAEYLTDELALLT